MIIGHGRVSLLGRLGAIGAHSRRLPFPSFSWGFRIFCSVSAQRRLLYRIWYQMLPAVCTKKVEGVVFGDTIKKKSGEVFGNQWWNIQFDIPCSIHLQDVRIAFQWIPIPFLVQSRWYFTAPRANFRSDSICAIANSFCGLFEKNPDDVFQVRAMASQNTPTSTPVHFHSAMKKTSFVPL